MATTTATSGAGRRPSHRPFALLGTTGNTIRAGPLAVRIACGSLYTSSRAARTEDSVVHLLWHEKSVTRGAVADEFRVPPSSVLKGLRPQALDRQREGMDSWHSRSCT